MAVDRHRRLKVDGRGDDTEPRRKQKRIEDDTAHDAQKRRLRVRAPVWQLD